MRTKFRLLAVTLIAGGTVFAQSQLSIGVGVGGYGPNGQPPPAYAQYQPPCPAPGYTWVDGYWASQGGRNIWTAGFWRAPVAPSYIEPRHYNTYRGNDRDGRERGRDNQARNRGDERPENHNRGNGDSNGSRR